MKRHAQPLLGARELENRPELATRIFARYARTHARTSCARTQRQTRQAKPRRGEASGAEATQKGLAGWRAAALLLTLPTAVLLLLLHF